MKKNARKETNSRRSAARNALLRRAVVLQLEAADPSSVSASIIGQGLAAAGLKASQRDVMASLAYLEGKGLVKTFPSLLSASEIRARLTAAGLDFVESGEF